MLFMGWQESAAVDERRKFIDDWLKREYSFSELCNRFKISRKTGYKLLDRFRSEGDIAFQDRSRARLSQSHALSKSGDARTLDDQITLSALGASKNKRFLGDSKRISKAALSQYDTRSF